MTMMEEKQMLRDIHKIAIALEKIAKWSCTGMEKKSSESHENEMDLAEKILKHYDDQMLGSAT